MSPSDSDIEPDESENPEAVVVGAGPAGLSAAVFASRAGFDTTVIEDGSSILRRNAHLENFLGFPAGVNSRLLLDMGREQAERSGAEFVRADVKVVEHADGDGFVVRTDEGDHTADYVVVASWADASVVDSLDLETTQQGSKTYVETEDGRTGVEGLYVAGRIAGQPHQTIVNAGHGAKVALSMIHDSDVPFYHDWVAPEGYFTDRGRDVPPGCEEITEEERRKRERESLEVMREHFEEAHPDEPTPHPSQRAE
ncbi:MAG: FAD-dependent oxidoreductase [Halobacteriales archaeon]|nr:FAD-dependent oxidoreductase [Halobacteriales archaeon]